MVLKQFLVLLALATVIGLTVNVVSPNRIALVEKYRSLSSGDGLIVPRTAEKGDPPFIDIGQAQMEHHFGRALFVDTRDPEEFVCGTIPGSINIPFEHLPEGDLAEYFDSALNGASRDRHLVLFCSGEECDLSLHMGRNLYTLGYTNVLIFFGGSREWEKHGLGIERRSECDR